MTITGLKLVLKERGKQLFSPNLVPCGDTLDNLNTVIRQYLFPGDNCVLTISPKEILATKDATRAIAKTVKFLVQKKKGTYTLERIAEGIYNLLFQFGILIETDDEMHKFLFDSRQMSRIKNLVQTNNLPTKPPSRKQIEKRMYDLINKSSSIPDKVAKQEAPSKHKTYSVLSKSLRAALATHQNEGTQALIKQILSIARHVQAGNVGEIELTALALSEQVEALEKYYEDRALDKIVEELGEQAGESADSEQIAKDAAEYTALLAEEQKRVKQEQDKLVEDRETFDGLRKSFQARAKEQMETLAQMAEQLPFSTSPVVDMKKLISMYSILNIKSDDISSLMMMLGKDIELLEDEVVPELKESLRYAQRAQDQDKILEYDKKIAEATEVLSKTSARLDQLKKISTKYSDRISRALNIIINVQNAVTTLDEFEEVDKKFLDSLDLDEIKELKLPLRIDFDADELLGRAEVYEDEEEDEFDEDEEVFTVTHDPQEEEDSFEDFEYAEDGETDEEESKESLDSADSASPDPSSQDEIQVIREEAEVNETGQDEVVEICQNIETIDLKNGEFSAFQMLLLKTIACYYVASKITYCTGEGKNKKAHIRARVIHSIFSKMQKVGLVDVVDFDDRDRQIDSLIEAIPVLVENDILKEGTFVPKVSMHSHTLILGKRLKWINRLVSLDLQLSFMDQLSEQDEKYKT